MILEKIKKPNDIHKVSLEDFPRLAEEIRSFLIQSVSETGGHLASNLGVVELTLALHNVLDLPQDKLIWDVGHQAYTHKILTGRKDGFKDLRKEGGLSGFPKRNESDCDSFDTGHSSNSISAGLGYVRARDLMGEKYHLLRQILPCQWQRSHEDPAYIHREGSDRSLSAGTKNIPQKPGSFPQVPCLPQRLLHVLPQYPHQKNAPGISSGIGSVRFHLA